MSVKSFTIGGVQYNAAMASAVDQDRLMSLLSAGLIERSLTAAAIGNDLDDSILVPMLMAMPQAAKTQVAGILMGRVMVNGTTQPVTAADFSGKMVQYNQLLAGLLRWNLGDFFDWLRAAHAEGKEQRAPAAAQ
ncbi:hypothetical protein KUC69_24400 [Pseudomonas aeruginosa]|uniref:hypothetical protein n=1 Tax=Pseudomonas aeruginosa TaxID=287 RepID=UPI0021E2AAEB|nr:hypothetical protein [Pseudomonas aeruginosa]MCV0061543.1 hypothetical protein [Pseudomonas aeruginosa]